MTSRGAVAAIRWVPLGEPHLVAGHEVDAVYVGDGDGDEPSAIDRTLPTDRRAPDWDAGTVERPPRYRDLTDAARSAYLIWLRTGRRSPQAPAVWALLFLLGLERRVLVDGDHGLALLEEVRHLNAVYGDDSDVRRIARALLGRPRAAAVPELDDTMAPDDLVIELGRRSLAAEPVDAEWARAWAWFHPDIRRPAAATRAPEEFSRVWAHHFDGRYPDGLVVPPRRRRLEIGYVPSNSSLPSPIELTVADASDVFLSPHALPALRDLSQEVESALEPYVRRLARQPDGSAPATAAATLPPEALSGSAAGAAVAGVVDYATDALGDGSSVLIEASTLLERWAESGGRRDSSRDTALALAQVLDRFGIGLEPDVRFGAPAPVVGEPAVLFRFEPPAVQTPSSAYATAVITLELCSVVAAADGVVADAEHDLLVDQVDRVEGLADAERARLAARRLLLTRSAADLDHITARLGAVASDDRQQLGDYLVEVARIDGEVSDSERRTVLSVHRLLGLDSDAADARLTADVSTSAPPADPEETDDAVTERLVDLDEHRLRETQDANRNVRDLLTAIFADDEDDASEASAPEAPGNDDVVDGLDEAHSALLRDLADAGEAGRAEIERMARAHRVLPEGAIDLINDVAFDGQGDPVLEVHDDGSVSVDREVYEGMVA